MMGRRNQTKVGLKAAGTTARSCSKRAKKSDQGGIERFYCSFEARELYLKKSDQGGIERRSQEQVSY